MERLVEMGACGCAVGKSGSPGHHSRAYQHRVVLCYSPWDRDSAACRSYQSEGHSSVQNLKNSRARNIRAENHTWYYGISSWRSRLNEEMKKSEQCQAQLPTPAQANEMISNGPIWQNTLVIRKKKNSTRLRADWPSLTLELACYFLAFFPNTIFKWNTCNASMPSQIQKQVMRCFFREIKKTHTHYRSSIHVLYPLQVQFFTWNLYFTGGVWVIKNKGVD